MAIQFMTKDPVSSDLPALAKGVGEQTEQEEVGEGEESRSSTSDTEEEFTVSSSQRSNSSSSLTFDVPREACHETLQLDADVHSEEQNEPQSVSKDAVYSSHSTDTTSTATVTSSSASTARRVRFGGLEIHEHPIMLGGAGVPRVGAPITLSWDAEAHFTVQSVEEYDNLKEYTRSGEQLLCTKDHRARRLSVMGYTMREIQKEATESNIVRERRMRSAKPSFLERVAKVVRRRTPSKALSKS